MTTTSAFISMYETFFHIRGVWLLSDQANNRFKKKIQIKILAFQGRHLWLTLNLILKLVFKVVSRRKVFLLECPIFYLRILNTGIILCSTIWILIGPHIYLKVKINVGCLRDNKFKSSGQNQKFFQTKIVAFGGVI